MEVDKFRKQLREATTAVVKLTSHYCSNSLSENYEYLIVPNTRSISKHLDKEELKVLSIWNKNQNKSLLFEQTVNLLHNNNRVPLWINITVYKSIQSKTIIKLFCSRRLRNEQELMHKDKIPPFNILITLPPLYDGIQDKKFDINWQVEDKKTKYQTLLNWIKLPFKF